MQQHKEEIEQALFWRDRDLLAQPVDVVLYDLTTLRFESTRNEEGSLRRFGYSKEKRSDCTQVVLGLMVTPQGIPVGFEVYPGNRFEGATVQDIAKKMRQKFKIRRFIFVADRGLFSAKNLKTLRADKGEFIVGMKLGVFRDRHDVYYDPSRLRWLNEELGWHETEHRGDRVIVTWSKARAERDQKARDDILAKIRKKLSGKGSALHKLVTHKAYKKYVREKSPAQIVIDDDAIALEARRDGFFGIIPHYKSLWEVEYAFGEIKGTLKARPICHWTDPRIVGHLTLCFMAYFCEALLTKALREKAMVLQSPAIDQKIINPRPLTVVEAMRELNDVLAIPVALRNKTFWVRTDIAGNANKLLACLGIKPPARVLTTQSTPAAKS